MASNSSQLRISIGAPKALITSTAAGGEGKLYRAEVAMAGVYISDASSTSKRKGSSPAFFTACALAMKVNEGIRQRLRPGSARVRRANSIAEVPLLVGTTRTPLVPARSASYAANPSVNSCQSGPSYCRF